MSRLGLLAVAAVIAQAPASRLTLEIRVFAGTEEVTPQTRVTVHRAAERGQPVARAESGEPSSLIRVPAGLYDAQAVRLREGRVVNIRWAERLVVMPYPDEHGHHLEVINFSPGYGALQVRGADPDAAPDVALFPTGRRDHPARAVPGPGYALFVVRAGTYDLQVRRGSQVTWHGGIEVPADRTRLWVVPPGT